MTEISMVDAIGEPAMYEQLAEECNELGKAALKLARVLRGENPTPLTEEAARAKVIEEFTDVAQITGELDLIIDVDQQDKKRRRFWERWEKKDDTRIAEISVAIRKSKATRPIINYDYADLIQPIKMWECPTCHAHYSYIDHKAGYCMACGQHIDWTNESILKWRREHGKRTL